MKLKTLYAFLISTLGLGVSGLACTGGDAGDAASSESAAMTISERPKIESFVKQTNLVSNQDGKAAYTDANLVNAWGLAFNPNAEAAWVSSNGKGLYEVFNAKGKTILEVTVPLPKNNDKMDDDKDGKDMKRDDKDKNDMKMDDMKDATPAAPTGTVFNGWPTAFMGDRFIVVTEDGTVSGWQPSLDGKAALRVDKSKEGAVFKGVAIAVVDGKPQLYVADFHNGKVDVFDDDYKPVWPSGGFVDKKLPKGFAPFNIFTIDDHLLVSYALQDADAHDDVKGPGNGFVDVYDADGNFENRLISGGALNSPWGMVLAPEKSKDDKKDNKDKMTGKMESMDVDLFVGNFGDGTINVYDLRTRGKHLRAVFEGSLADKDTHAPLVIDGLWALVFGPGGNTGFGADDLFFTAGPDDESNGLFGKLELFGDRK